MSMHDGNYLSTSSVSRTQRLTQILRPSSYAQFTTTNKSVMSRSSRYLPGHIWKHTFSVCIYSDLDGLSPAVLWRRNTRFVRLEDFGLSGVILYELPVFHGIDGKTRPALTLEGVFGSEKRDYEDGMSIAELLDAAGAKLVYFPTYACTSFIVGQLMHAFLTGDQQLRPHPARDGFYVYHETPETNDEAHSHASSPDIPLLNKAHEREDLSSSDSDTEQNSEHCNSSVDSFSPQTPPSFGTSLLGDFRDGDAAPHETKGVRPYTKE